MCISDSHCVFVSSGCVVAELFTEGVPLFDLSQLLAYRKGHFQTEQVLRKIEDQSIRELVKLSLWAGWLSTVKSVLLIQTQIYAVKTCQCSLLDKQTNL